MSKEEVPAVPVNYAPGPGWRSERMTTTAQIVTLIMAAALSVLATVIAMEKPTNTDDRFRGRDFDEWLVRARAQTGIELPPR